MNVLYSVHLAVAHWTSNNLALIMVVFTLIIVAGLVTFLSDEPTVEKEDRS